MAIPKISVVVPVYGVEKYLKECLDSILNQSFKDIEVILVDDGSKDRCPQIIDEYAEKDSRIVPVHKKNGGYGSAVNCGLSIAKGEYISIIEPDDYIDKDMYADLFSIAEKNNSDIVKSNFIYFLDSPEKKDYWPGLASLNTVDDAANVSFTLSDCPSLVYGHPSVWSAIYKKSFLDDNNIRMIEVPGSGWTDNPFQVQTMCLASKINFTDKAYYYWRVLNNNPSDELNDYKIPFLRSAEIHDWLEKNNIQNNDILFNLTKRELYYICLVLNKTKIDDLQDCFARISALCERISPVVNRNLKRYTRWEREVFFGCLDNIEKFRKRVLRYGIKGPFYYYWSFNYIRKLLIRFHVRKGSFLIIIAGIAFTNRNDAIYPKPFHVFRFK